MMFFLNVFIILYFKQLSKFLFNCNIISGLQGSKSRFSTRRYDFERGVGSPDPLPSIRVQEVEFISLVSNIKLWIDLIMIGITFQQVVYLGTPKNHSPGYFIILTEHIQSY
jgi:hypothetical protein